MKFNTDSYFQIGSAHYSAGKPCQDYAVSGSNESMATAIVSDGCSSGKRTDVGSRVLALGTLEVIVDHTKAFKDSLDGVVVRIDSRQQQIIDTTQIILGLDPDDMLATCLYVYMTLNGGLVHIQGDGAVAFKFKDGHIDMYRYEWADNRPFYPSYINGRLEGFVRSHGGNPSSPKLFLNKITRTTTGYYISEICEKFSIEEGISGITLEISKDELEEIDFVAVFSDGVSQIENTDWKEAVSDFMAFKNTTGDFAKRRMIRGIKEMQKIGKGPIDDISYAVVRIEH